MEHRSWPELEDVEREILVRLPLEDLGRCKVVCKEWRDLISSPDFVSKHLLRSQSDPSQHLILFHVNDNLHREPAWRPFKSVVCFSSLSSDVVGSVNGLICIAGNFLVTSPDDIWILNPVSRLSIKLPLPAASPTVENRDAVSFAFCWDSSDSKERYKVFKVVCKFGQHDLDPHLPEYSEFISKVRPVVSNRVEVWDSHCPHTWTEITVDFPSLFYHPPGWITRRDIVVGSFAYWIVAGANGLDLFLLSANLKTHALKLISLPSLSTPSDVLVGKLGRRTTNKFLFGAIWEERFALVEKCSETMLYNVWAMNDSGTSWIKKTTFLVDFGFKRFIACVDGKLLLERDDLLKIIFDMKTKKGRVLGKTEIFNSKMSTEQHKIPLFGNTQMRNRFERFYDFPNTFVSSAHDFVGTLVSIEGFKPIRSFASCPCFNVFWPNLPAFSSEVSSSTSSVASGEKAPPVIEPASAVVLPTATSVNVSPAVAKGSVPSAEKVKVKPVGAPASNVAPKKTYASLVANWTPVNSPKAARISPKAPPVPLADGAPKNLASVTKVATKSMTDGNIVPDTNARPEARRVFVRNLPLEMIAVLEKFGRVWSYFQKRGHQNDGNYCAFVEFKSLESACLAVEAGKVHFGDQRIAFVEFEKSINKSGSRSPTRGRY